MLRAAWLAAALLALGCSSTSSQDGPSGGPGGPGAGDADTGDADMGDAVELMVEIGPDWLRGVHPEDLPEETYVIGAAAHEDAAEAQARAVIALERAVWGPVAERPRFRKLPNVFIEGDPTRQEPLEDGRTGVLVAVELTELDTRIEDWLDDAAADMLPKGVPDEPAPQIEAALKRMQNRALETYGCERRRAVTRGECELSRGGDSPFRIAAALVDLRPALEGGIPRFPDQPPLRPAGVGLFWQKQDGEMVPWSGVPLMFTAPEGMLAAASATTNASGYAEVAFAGEPSDGVIQVALDTEQVFGDLAGEWPGTSTELRLRVVTPSNARIAVHLFEHISQEPTDERTTTEAVVKHLKKLGYNGAVVLPLELAESLEDARAGKFKAAVRKLSEAAGGKADIVVMGEAHSDFLSRAVGRSVWHEAMASAKVFDLWTGRHIGDVERETRAKGMGDFNAARKAMKALGQDLAIAVRDTLAEGKLTASATPAATLATR